MSRRHWLKFGVRSAHFTSSHASSSCAHVVCLILLDSPFLFLLSIFSPIVLFILLSLSLLPRCGGQIPYALSLMRTLAPLPSTTLSQVMSPTTCTSQRPLNCTSMNPPARTGPLSTMTTPSAWRSSPLFTQEREDAASHRRAYHSPDEGLSSSQSSSVGHRTGRPVVEQFGSLISNVRENPRRSSENEQIRILLERQREQILADCQAEIQKHEFQADYDRRSIQTLNEIIESQNGEFYRAHQGDERLRRDQQLLHEQVLEQNWDLREAHGEKSQ